MWIISLLHSNLIVVRQQAKCAVDNEPRKVQLQKLE